MKKVAFLVLVLIVVSSLLISCTNPAPPVKPTTSSTAPATSQIQPQKWTFIIYRGNLNAFMDKHTQDAFDRIKELTNGVLDIKTAPNGSLPIKQNDQLRAVSEGQLEMGILHSQYHSSDFPLFGVIDTPFLAANQTEKGIIVEATWAIVKRELAKMNIIPLAYQGFGEPGLYLTKPVANIMDMGGAKMRAQAMVYTLLIEAIKGTPTPVEWGETYTALQRGMIQGVVTGFDSITGAKIQEVAPYAYRVGLSPMTSYICVNKKKWEELPANIQYIVLDELSRAMITIQADVPNIADVEIAKQKAGGLKNYDPTLPSGWQALMSEKVAKPMLKDALSKAGSTGQELITVIEKALGRSVK